MSRSLGDRLVTSRSPMQIVAAVDLLEAGEHPQAGGLAAAGGADQDEELAVGDLEVELVDRGLCRCRGRSGWPSSYVTVAMVKVPPFTGRNVPDDPL